jgi:hypothetical protein
MKKLLILAAIAGISFLSSVANAQERLGDGAMGALAGTGIIAMSIIANIRRDNPALRGFA